MSDGQPEDADVEAGERPASPRSGHVMTPEEEKKRKQRNAAIALGLAAFIVLVFLVTIFRIGGDIVARPF